MIRGTYLMRFDGSINQQIMNPRASSAFLPAFGTGMLSVDPEAGSLTGTGLFNWGGTMIHTVLKSGGFRVSPDCTAVLDYESQVLESNSTMKGSFPMIVTDNGDRMIVLQTSLPAFAYYERLSIP